MKNQQYCVFAKASCGLYMSVSHREFMVFFILVCENVLSYNRFDLATANQIFENFTNEKCFLLWCQWNSGFIIDISDGNCDRNLAGYLWTHYLWVTPLNLGHLYIMSNTLFLPVEGTTSILQLVFCINMCLI